MKEDLSNTWKISVAIKIAAPILWLIVISSIILSAIIDQDAEKYLHLDIEENIDTVAHEIEDLIRNSETHLNQNHNLNHHLDHLLKQFSFSAVEFIFNNNPVVIGQKRM
ncbi:MAG: hypothetical protein OEZ38_12530, partial [Gammaproteobacteria bacterium]|nr:hypothetical protein [Gammaproteobacteria bacterium]